LDLRKISAIRSRKKPGTRGFGSLSREVMLSFEMGFAYCASGRLDFGFPLTVCSLAGGCHKLLDFLKVFRRKARELDPVVVHPVRPAF
jgi:hypothetical protein